MASVTFEDLSRQFDELIHRVEHFDARVPEDSALIGLAADIVPKVTRLLRQGVELLSLVESIYDGSQADIGKSEEDEDTLFHIGRLISAELASRDLADVAFLARNELRNTLEKLERTATVKRNDSLALATQSEAGLRCLRKALVSMESAIFEFEERTAPDRQWDDIEVSLQIRKLYWNLRNETEDSGEDDEDLESRLRRVLYRIMAFRELSVYPFLRVDDRVNLRDLLKRILDWLNSDDRDSIEARQLWADLSSFSALSVQVSRRQELQAYDLSVLAKVSQELWNAAEPADELSRMQLTELEQLLGLDDELDDLICSRIRYPDAWKGAVERVIQELRRPASSNLNLLSDADFT